MFQTERLKYALSCREGRCLIHGDLAINVVKAKVRTRSSQGHGQGQSHCQGQGQGQGHGQGESKVKVKLMVKIKVRRARACNGRIPVLRNKHDGDDDEQEKVSECLHAWPHTLSSSCVAQWHICSQRQYSNYSLRPVLLLLIILGLEHGYKIIQWSFVSNGAVEISSVTSWKSLVWITVTLRSMWSRPRWG